MDGELHVLVRSSNRKFSTPVHQREPAPGRPHCGGLALDCVRAPQGTWWWRMSSKERSLDNNRCSADGPVESHLETPDVASYSGIGAMMCTYGVSRHITQGPPLSGW